MLQGVFRILIFESRQMKDVRLLDDRLKRRESRWVRKACMSWALDDGDLYMDENVIFVVAERDRDGKAFKYFWDERCKLIPDFKR